MAFPADIGSTAMETSAEPDNCVKWAPDDIPAERFEQLHHRMPSSLDNLRFSRRDTRHSLRSVANIRIGRCAHPKRRWRLDEPPPVLGEQLLSHWGFERALRVHQREPGTIGTNVGSVSRSALFEFDAVDLVFLVPNDARANRLQTGY